MKGSFVIDKWLCTFFTFLTNFGEKRSILILELADYQMFIIAITHIPLYLCVVSVPWNMSVTLYDLAENRKLSNCDAWLLIVYRMNMLVGRLNARMCILFGNMKRFGGNSWYRERSNVKRKRTRGWRSDWRQFEEDFPNKYRTMFASPWMPIRHNS